MNGVKRYGHISYLVEATPQILKLYPEMTVYVFASDFDAALAVNRTLNVQMDALREELDRHKVGHERLGGTIEKLVAKVKDRNQHLIAAKKELSELEDEFDTVEHNNIDLKMYLAAAEQRNAELVALCAQSRTVINQFMPNAGKCFGIDFALLNETLCDIDRAVNKPTESVAYQSREIGESDWADCTKAEYDHFGKDPHMDTRIKPTESGASE